MNQSVQTTSTDNKDFYQLIDVLPERIKTHLWELENLEELLEIVTDLGRKPEIRFLNHTEIINVDEITKEDLNLSIEKVGAFSSDNRAGIERTLHRISAIKNRSGEIKKHENPNFSVRTSLP